MDSTILAYVTLLRIAYWVLYNFNDSEAVCKHPLFHIDFEINKFRYLIQVNIGRSETLCYFKHVTVEIKLQLYLSLGS